MNETDTQTTPTTNTGEITITDAVETLVKQQGLTVQAASDKLGIYFSAYYDDRQRPPEKRRLLSSIKHRAARPYTNQELRAFIERVKAYIAKHNVAAKEACRDLKVSYRLFLKSRSFLGLTHHESSVSRPVFKKHGIVPIQNADGSWSAGCPKCEKDWTMPNVRRLAKNVSRHLVTVHGLRSNLRLDRPVGVETEPEPPVLVPAASEPTNTDTFYCPHCGTHLSLNVQVNLKSVTAHRQ